MAVCSSAMGPERVLPSCEDDLADEQRPAADVTVMSSWSGGEGEGPEGEDEELDSENGDGYYYQPLNQEPEGSEDAHSQIQQVQDRIQDMGLHLPPPPSTESDADEEEGEMAQGSRASIPMDDDHVELVKRTMAAVALPSLAVPPWAKEISDDQWSDMVQNTLTTRQSAAALRHGRKGE